MEQKSFLRLQLESAFLPGKNELLRRLMVCLLKIWQFISTAYPHVQWTDTISTKPSPCPSGLNWMLMLEGLLHLRKISNMYFYSNCLFSNIGIVLIQHLEGGYLSNKGLSLLANRNFAYLALSVEGFRIRDALHGSGGFHLCWTIIRRFATSIDLVLSATAFSNLTTSVCLFLVKRAGLSERK